MSFVFKNEKTSFLAQFYSIKFRKVVNGWEKTSSLNDWVDDTHNNKASNFDNNKILYICVVCVPLTQHNYTVFVLCHSEKNKMKLKFI